MPLHFEFYREPNAESMVTTGTPAGENFIDIPDLMSYEETPLEMLRLLVSKFSIPAKFHAALFARIRLCKAASSNSRLQFVVIRLLAFIILGLNAVYGHH